jgi:hypothetical protein
MTIPSLKKTAASKTLVKSTMTKNVATINFRVPLEFKKNFKITAATHGITQSDLLLQIFEEWQQKHKC